MSCKAATMTLIDWPKVQDTKSLILALEKALLEIFGKDFIGGEIRKFRQYSPKRPEALAYLRPYPIHRAAKWFMLLERLKERGYSFDLRFSAERKSIKESPQSLSNKPELRACKGIKGDARGSLHQ